jgi:hypothetical protein
MMTTTNADEIGVAPKADSPTESAVTTLTERHVPWTAPADLGGRVARVLEGVTYKPGWSFHVTSFEQVLYLEAHHAEVDSRDGHDLPDFARRIPIRWPTYSADDDEAILAWVRHCIHEWEVHEADEWLRYQGEHVHDPHVCKACKIGGCRA